MTYKMYCICIYDAHIKCYTNLINYIHLWERVNDLFLLLFYYAVYVLILYFYVVTRPGIFGLRMVYKFKKE